MGETADVVVVVLLVHLHGAHEGERLGDGHRDLFLTPSPSACIDEAKDEVHATGFRTSSRRDEAQNRRQIAVDGVLARQREGMQER